MLSYCIRLTQLLEEPPKESLQEVVFDENMVNEYASVPASGSTANLWTNLRQVTNDDSEQPSSPSESDQSNKAKPASPVSQDTGGEASTSSSSEEIMDDKSSSTPATVTNLASHMDGDFQKTIRQKARVTLQKGGIQRIKNPLRGYSNSPSLGKGAVA